MKALETPEEKRARRLAKKEAKERKKREKMGWSEEYMGYTNADNPFGDNNLLGTFKWQKVFHFTYIYRLPHCYAILFEEWPKGCYKNGIKSIFDFFIRH